MKVAKDRPLAVPCQVCGARPGQMCELNSGGPRHQTHLERRYLAMNITFRKVLRPKGAGAA